MAEKNRLNLRQILKDLKESKDLKKIVKKTEPWQ